MDTQLRAAIAAALLSMQSQQPRTIAEVSNDIAARLQAAISTYTHAYVAQQMNMLILANQVGQPARLNPIVSG